MTQPTTVWQSGSSDPHNTDHLAVIRQWWAGLNGKRINWRQRVLPGTVPASTLNWEPQRFDETFVISQPELRGITLYWHKPEIPQERSTTPHRLELDTLRQELYIFPQSQKELVIRIEQPDLAYQTVKLQPDTCTYSAETQLLIVRDGSRRIELQLQLTPALLSQLQEELQR